MTQISEAQMGGNMSVAIEELQTLVHQERAHSAQLSRLARSTKTTDTMVGGIAGAGLGILSGVALVSGIVPGVESLSAMGPAIPVAFGAFLSGVGMITGSFVDLQAVANIWRR